VVFPVFLVFGEAQALPKRALHSLVVKLQNITCTIENVVNGLSKIDAGLISKLLHKPQTPMAIYASKIYKDNPFFEEPHEKLHFK